MPLNELEHSEQRQSMMAHLRSHFEEPVMALACMLAWTWSGKPGQSVEEVKRGLRREVACVDARTADGRALMVAVETGRAGDSVEPMRYGPVDEPFTDGRSNLLLAFFDGPECQPEFGQELRALE